MNRDSLDSRATSGDEGRDGPVETLAEGGSAKLEKTFDPAIFEEQWYRTWEEEGRFQPVGPPGSPRFVMVIPPPNVTGRLHIGHAFGRTL
jgi:valyl-tRNA synthetase